MPNAWRKVWRGDQSARHVAGSAGGFTQLQIDSGETDPRARVQAVFASIEQLTLDAQTLRAEIETVEVAATGDTVQIDRLRESDLL